jgi:hypothetical protein
VATDSTATVTTGQDETLNVPAYELSADEARLLRVYRVWLDRKALVAKLWCPSCERTRESGMEIALNDLKVGLICPHGLWFGLTPPATLGISGHGIPQERLIETGEIEEQSLNAFEAHMLWAYKRFLIRYQLQEALYCLACGLNKREDGCRASVTPDRIRIECRHAIRSYQKPR